MGNWGSVPLGEATELVSVVPLEAEGGQLWGPSNLPHPPLQPVTVVQLGSLWSVSMEALRAKGTWTEHTSRATPLHFIRRGTKVQDNGGTGRAVSTLAYQCCPSTHVSPYLHNSLLGTRAGLQAARVSQNTSDIAVLSAWTLENPTPAFEKHPMSCF